VHECVDMQIDSLEAARAASVAHPLAQIHATVTCNQITVLVVCYVLCVLLAACRVQKVESVS
jgi:hypothetical protein